MNSGVLTLLLLATGCAAWSADDGMVAGERPLAVAVWQQAAPPIEVTRQGCIVGARQRVVLRAPRVDPTGPPATDHARAERALVEDWRRQMTEAGVPNDLIDRTTRMPNRTYELSSHDMDRLGCVIG